MRPAASSLYHGTRRSLAMDKKKDYGASLVLMRIDALTTPTPTPTPCAASPPSSPHSLAAASPHMKLPFSSPVSPTASHGMHFRLHPLPSFAHHRQDIAQQRAPASPSDKTARFHRPWARRHASESAAMVGIRIENSVFGPLRFPAEELLYVIDVPIDSDPPDNDKPPYSRKKAQMIREGKRPIGRGRTSVDHVKVEPRILPFSREENFGTTDSKEASPGSRSRTRDGFGDSPPQSPVAANDSSQRGLRKRESIVNMFTKQVRRRLSKVGLRRESMDGATLLPHDADMLDPLVSRPSSSESDTAFSTIVEEECAVSRHNTWPVVGDLTTEQDDVAAVGSWAGRLKKRVFKSADASEVASAAATSSLSASRSEQGEEGSQTQLKIDKEDNADDEDEISGEEWLTRLAQRFPERNILSLWPDIQTYLDVQGPSDKLERLIDATAFTELATKDARQAAEHKLELIHRTWRSGSLQYLVKYQDFYHGSSSTSGTSNNNTTNTTTATTSTAATSATAPSTRPSGDQQQNAKIRADSATATSAEGADADPNVAAALTAAVSAGRERERRDSAREDDRRDRSGASLHRRLSTVKTRVNSFFSRSGKGGKAATVA